MPLPPLRWAIWILAGLGVLYQQLFHERYKWLETLIYLLIGIGPSVCIYEMVSSRYIMADTEWLITLQATQVVCNIQQGCAR